MLFKKICAMLFKQKLYISISATLDTDYSYFVRILILLSHKAFLGICARNELNYVRTKFAFQYFQACYLLE